jgi:brefeldin A-inhibited guanine nucleotide-exchange protein
LTPQELAVQLICRCDEAYEEALEVLILRGLLTAATSITFTLHGQALLLAVRTCYNIHLMSRSEVNQTTAKATLTQMLNVVFQRMEADSVLVAVKPIVVADMLGLTNARTASPADGMVSAVQGFLNSVVAVAGYSQQPTPEQVKLSVAEAMSRRDSLGSQDGSESSVSSELGEDGERFQLALEAAAAAAGGGTAAGDGAAASGEQAGEAGSREGSGGGAAAGKPGAGQASGSSSHHTHHHGSGHHHGGHHHHHHAGSSTSVLLKDAFLVFRALCKLSIRTSDSVTVADPTAVRGKVGAVGASGVPALEGARMPETAVAGTGGTRRSALHAWVQECVAALAADQAAVPSFTHIVWVQLATDSLQSVAAVPLFPVLKS